MFTNYSWKVFKIEVVNKIFRFNAVIQLKLTIFFLITEMDKEKSVYTLQLNLNVSFVWFFFVNFLNLIIVYLRVNGIRVCLQLY